MDKLNQIKVIYELTKDLVDDELSMIDEGKLHCTYNFYQKIISTEKIFTKIEYIVLYLHDEVEPLEPLEPSASLETLEILEPLVPLEPSGWPSEPACRAFKASRPFRAVRAFIVFRAFRD